MCNYRIVSRCASLVFAALAASLLLTEQTLFAKDVGSFDWRNVNGSNWNSTVKTQFGGTCWDFSAVGVFESRYMLARNDPAFIPDMSEQQIVWENSPDMGSSSTGYGTPIVPYVQTHGLVSEAECPPNNSNTPTSWNTPPGGYPFLTTGWENRVFKTSNGFGPDIHATADIKAALKAQGPMVTALNPGRDMFNSVTDLITYYKAPTPGEGHVVSVVGYVDDSAGKPATPTGGYWIVKDSYGPNQGDGGYKFVPYGTLEYHSGTQNFLGVYYYSGAMTTATWTGGSGTWALDNATKWNSGAYAWENKETAAVFGGTGGTVTVNGVVIAHSITVNSAYTFTGGSVTVTCGGIQANESATINAPVTVGAPQTWSVAAGKTLAIGKAVHTVISDLTLAGAGDVSIAGVIDGGGVLNTFGTAKPGRLFKSNTGKLTLTGAGTFANDMTLNAGTLYLAPAGSVSAIYSGALVGGIPMFINTAGTVSLGAGAANFTGPITVQAGTLAFIPASGVVATYSNAISGSGSILQNGPGTTILSGSNACAGPTTVSAGTLALGSSGAIASTPSIDVRGGAIFDVSAKGSWSLGGTQTLKGSGTVKGAVIAVSGSQISPGDSVGTLSFLNNLTLADGAVLDFDLGAFSASDKISLTGSTLTLNGLDFSDFRFTTLGDFGQNGSYVLMDAGSISGSLGTNLTGVIGDKNATLYKSGNQVLLSVPEPGTLAMLAVGLIGIAAYARRKRQ